MGGFLGGSPSQPSLGFSVQHEPGQDARTSLGDAYDRLVAANPLPPRVKNAVLATALGSPETLRNVLRAAGRHVGPTAGASSTEEEVLLQLTRMAMATVPAWPQDALGPWRAVSGPHFGAWANLVAFAAQAAIVSQCHLLESE